MAILPLLMAICLMSTGLAGWVSVYNSAAQVSGGFESYGVIDSTSVITTSGPQIFSIKAESFVDENGKKQDYGSIIVPYSIDLTKCTSSSITVNLSLSYDGLAVSNENGLFVKPAARTDGYAYSYTITFGIDTDGDEVADLKVENLAAAKDATKTSGDITLTNGGTYLDASVNMTVTPGSGVKTFNVIYTFNIPRDMTDSGGNTLPLNFRECFGKYLDVRADSQTEFVTTAWVKEN